MTDTSVLLREHHDGVEILTFNRPHKKNALDGALFSAIGRALDEVRADDSVRVVLMAGAGGNFCSGMDLTASFDDEGAAPFDECAEAVAAFDKPLVCAVQGVAIGGGATIPFHADVVYVGESLRMRLPFANLGLVPEFASSYMLQANIGARRAAELMYTAEWIDAARALDVGIATAIFPDADLLSRAKAKAAEIAQWPVGALREIKGTLRLAHKAGIAAALEAEKAAMMRQAGSPENIEAITAFIEKRPPKF